MKTFIKKTAIACFALLFSGAALAQSVQVNLTTVSYAGVYKPAHCFAMWISDANGNYVRTINYQGNKYKQYLTYCNAAALASSKVVTDGVTGESLPIHNWKYAYPSSKILRIPFTWDCKDQAGVSVPNGKYYLNVEYTEDNATGKYIQFEFEVGFSSATYTRTNETTNPGKWFSNVSVVYTAPTNTADELTLAQKFDYLIYSIDQNSLVVQNENPDIEMAQVQLYDIKGQKVYEVSLAKGITNTSINTSALNGMYIIRIISSKGIVSSRKVYIK